MSLLRLLTAGRCWISAKPLGRYKFSDPRSMPKFGAGTNPFKGKVTAGKKEEERRETEDGRTERVDERPEERLSEKVAPERVTEVAEGETEVVMTDAVASNGKLAEPDQPERLDAALEKTVGSKAEALKEWEKEEEEKDVKPGPGWISRISSLKSSLRMKLWTPPKSAPRPRPVQGELSLDNIKPVRNDLSETDLEVVPLRTSAIVKAKSKARPQPKAEAAEAAEGAIQVEKGPAPEAEQQQLQRHDQEQDLIEAGRT